MTNLPDQHIGYNSSFELKLYNKRGPEQNLNLGRRKKKKKKDNMRSSLPAFNQLQLSFFPQLEAKTHRGGKAEPKCNTQTGANIIQNRMQTDKLRGKRHENKELFYQMCRMSKVCKFVCTNDLWS